MDWEFSYYGYVSLKTPFLNKLVCVLFSLVKQMSDTVIVTGLPVLHLISHNESSSLTRHIEISIAPGVLCALYAHSILESLVRIGQQKYLVPAAVLS